jgi:hypothetical protein
MKETSGFRNFSFFTLISTQVLIFGIEKKNKQTKKTNKQNKTKTKKTNKQTKKKTPNKRAKLILEHKNK